ncbi:hypothetical protein TSAR_005401 [Trichomalopsis sarcophagae]|uniref:Uncharacterized protein n=1 Tax=Trichomalopsis sarcophagae TaxID=543379 RepID=A0A232EXQ6_9HYME|nr:hypothetical protein TSAR_005401 [Trichomalopsis sarcophagae]
MKLRFNSKILIAQLSTASVSLAFQTYLERGRTIPLFQRVPKHSERRGGILVCLCSGMPIAYLLIRCILRIYLKTKINN